MFCGHKIAGIICGAKLRLGYLFEGFCFLNKCERFETLFSIKVVSLIINLKNNLMNFNEALFDKDYEEFVVSLIDKSLNTKIYNFTSRSYLFTSLINELMAFEKKYIRKNNLYDFYATDEKFKSICSRYRNLAINVISNYYHNQTKHPNFSTIKDNYFDDIRNSMDFFLKSNLNNYLIIFKDLDKKLINDCNNILISEILKTTDIYTLRESITLDVEKWCSIFLNDLDEYLFSIVHSKIDNILLTTLNKFEEENKNYKQLYEYIPSTKKSIYHKNIISIEKKYKQTLLPLILDSKIEEALKHFKENIKHSHPKHNQLENDLFTKEVINKLNAKHILINISPDEFDI